MLGLAAHRDEVEQTREGLGDDEPEHGTARGGDGK
jgi:hypothetical protein